MYIYIYIYVFVKIRPHRRGRIPHPPLLQTTSPNRCRSMSQRLRIGMRFPSSRTAREGKVQSRTGNWNPESGIWNSEGGLFNADLATRNLNLGWTWGHLNHLSIMHMYVHLLFVCCHITISGWVLVSVLNKLVAFAPPLAGYEWVSNWLAKWVGKQSANRL